MFYYLLIYISNTENLTFWFLKDTKIKTLKEMFKKIIFIFVKIFTGLIQNIIVIKLFFNFRKTGIDIFNFTLNDFNSFRQNIQFHAKEKIQLPRKAIK